ncbi:MAG TPA: type II toxin-antitoxin system VapC family toxin [Longimicrobium sp.]|nr:type II toxin-antitoxin system VapC family toxin [Longimicrobium sp.]
MNVVDSSGWLEYLADAPNAARFAPAIEDTGRLIVPSISIVEVFRRTYQQRGETDALAAASLMRRGHVVELDFTLAASAGKLGVDNKLPLADSIILATARAYGATLWTQDADFEGIPGVRYFPKR